MSAPAPSNPANIPLSGAREGRLTWARRLLARAAGSDLAALVVPGPEVARAAGFDVEAAGLSLAAGPRQASVLVLLGPSVGLSQGLERAAEVAYAQMPRPRAVLVMPELARIRDILEKEDLCVVVQDAFLTETAYYADVVLPAALWGEKTGAFTNVDRTVHLSDKAVDPPGEAKSDLDICLDYARRMEFRDKDGEPLIKWHDPETAFEAWKDCTRGRLCDYTGLSYDKLRGRSGIQWPCNGEHPEGTERLYGDGYFVGTEWRMAETYGHDLLTGGSISEMEFRAMKPAGRAVLKALHYTPPHEEPGGAYPFSYTTGRTVYHWHTRTKTARAPQLQEAAPETWLEISPADGQRLGVGEGDLVRVESPRGRYEARARVSDIKEGVVFAPFHYGYFDAPGVSAPDGHPRAANELTVTEWDPVSKQPLFKIGAVRVEKIADSEGTPAPAPTTTAQIPHESGLVRATTGGRRAEATQHAESAR